MRARAVAGVTRIVFSPMTSHPIDREKSVARATLHRATATYYVSAPFDYVEWANGDWGVRTKTLANVLTAGVSVLPKSRFSAADKAALQAAIADAAQHVASSPPDTLVPVKPVFVCLDQDGKLSGLQYDVDDPVPMGHGFLVAPHEAAAYAGYWRKHLPEPKAAPFELYRRDSKARLLYREAWFADDTVVEHWGTCGSRGKTREHRAADEEAAARVLARLKKAAREAGYRPIPPSRMKMLIVEYALDGWGSPDDLTRRHALEDKFNDLVGWLGLGHLDGGSIGSGTMEIALVVVDFDIAKAALERETKGTEMAGFTRIYRGGD